MNKAQLIDAVAVAANLPKTVAGKALDAVLDCISETLVSGDMVTLMGFGNFSVKDRVGREGRNPKTGEKIYIKASKVPVFKAGKSLKDAVDQVDSDQADS